MIRYSRHWSLSVLVAVGSAGGAFAFSDLGFSYYALRGSVWQDPAGSDSELITSDAPASPVSETIDLASGPSTLAAAYSLSFDTQSILLRHQSQHAITYTYDWGSGSRSGASLAIRPDIPVEVRVAGTFTYDFTGWSSEGDTYVDSGFEISLLESGSMLHSVAASPIVVPGAGTALLDAAFTLPAGEVYGIAVGADIYTFRDNDGSTATAQADITVTIQAIPEPASVVGWIAALILGRVNRR